MKKIKAFCLLGAGALLIGILLSEISSNKREAPTRQLVNISNPKPQPDSELLAKAIQSPTASLPGSPEFSSTQAQAIPEQTQPPLSVNQKKVAPTKPRSPSKKPPLVDPLAREALTLVGTDSEAEAYWFSAINNPSLPAHEREDLIEDLNEEGLSDPKHPSAEDLPLLISRIEIIENVGPFAMDDVNEKAFQEAYKDLWNLLDLAMGGGKPVK